MILVIDCGNTNTKIGVYGDVASAAYPGPLRAPLRLDTDPHRPAEDYSARLAQVLSEAGLDSNALSGAAMASVVPAANEGLVAFARAATGADPVEVGAAGVDLGLKILVDRPGEVGADRLVNAVAAHAAWQGPLIVLDFGTGTTFDVVTDGGDYAGGVIAPGISLALDALHARAAMLPRIEVARPAAVIGRNTVAAMQSGIYWGYIGLIEGLVARIKAEYGGAGSAPFTVVATGGLAPLFAGGTAVIDVTDPDITLRGLALIYERNRIA